MADLTDEAYAILDCCKHLPLIRNAVARMNSPNMDMQYRAFHNTLVSFAASQDLLVQDFGEHTSVHKFPEHIVPPDAATG